MAASVVAGGRTREPALCAETLEDAAEIALVEPELTREVRGADAAVMRELVHHAHFGERERTIQQSFVEHADALRVEAVEASRGFDLAGEHGSSCWQFSLARCSAR